MDQQLNRFKNLLTTVGDYVNSSLGLTEEDPIKPQFVDWLSRQPFSEDLLSRYRLYLFQIKETNAENARLANMASTRMGRVTQALDEGAGDLTALAGQLRTIGTLAGQLDDVGRRVAALRRRFSQVELSLVVLERVHKAAVKSRLDPS